MKRRPNGHFVNEGSFVRLQKLAAQLTEINHEPDKCEIESVDVCKSGWGDGRRIVELGHLADQLKECKNCSKPLMLHKIQKEQRVGYASILYISCECGMMNNITTGKSHRPSDKSKVGMPVYDINTKAVIGKYE